LGEYIFKRTGIPDLLILIMIGLALGPAFQVFDPGALVAIAPFIAPIALMILLFDSGMGMNIFKFVERSPRAALLGLLNVVFCIAVCAPAMNLILGWDYLYGAILGAIVGGTSSPIVIPLVKSLNPKEEVGDMLVLESTVTDVLCIVSAIALIQIAGAGTGGELLSEGVRSIFAAFSVGAVLGVIAGIAWMSFIKELRVSAVAHLLTIAVLFLLYAFSEAVGGSGAISALFFGLVLGNSYEVASALRLKDQSPIDEWTMKLFQTELSFFVRTFFFVYLGAIVAIQQIEFLAIGLGITGLVLFARYAATFLSTIKSKYEEARLLIGIMAPRGLAAAVLSQLPLAYGLTHGEVFPDIVLVVLIATVVLTSLNAIFWKRLKKIGEAKPTEEKAKNNKS
jgi:cell volume regulation protein A